MLYISSCVIPSRSVQGRTCAMRLDDAWKTEIKVMDSNVNVLVITMENIVNTKNIVSIFLGGGCL